MVPKIYRAFSALHRLHEGGTMSVPKGGYKRPNPVNVCPQKLTKHKGFSGFIFAASQTNIGP